MIVELGHFALILALFVAVVQFAAPLAGLRMRDTRLMAMADAAAPIAFLLIAGSFAALLWAHINSDFSVANVWENSHSAKPLLYKISGVWGNHEGSMLLWVLILALFGAAVWLFGQNLPLDLRSAVLSIQGLILFTFTLFIVVTSNPFVRIPNALFEGQGLNPILQDPALAIHPPLLYAGYVGFSMAFSFAIAALLLGRVDSAWARWVRPWTLAAWIFLTIGIAIGSWWAYYTLGWGGWWFWDPVENASLMPWLTGTALLHSAIVMEKRDSLKAWTILLAILTFSFSLLGTFLVRSGVLTSVHSFASDPSRGVFILVIVSLFTAGGLLLFSWRSNSLAASTAFSVVSRESSLVLNNLFLTVSCGVVFVGTLYPLALEAATGDKISVGAPFFNSTVVWIFLPLLLLLPFGIFTAWKRGDLDEAARRLIPAAVAAVIVGIASVMAGAGFKTGLALTLGAWVFAGAVWEVLWRARFAQVSFGETARRIANMRRSQWGATLGHVGLAVSVIGIAGTTAWNAEHLAVMKPGDSIDVGSYSITFKKVYDEPGPNYTAQAGDFELKSGDRVIGTITSAKKKYDAPPQSTTAAGIAVRPFADVYVVLGNEAPGGAYSIRAYYHPFVRWIWGGAVLMFIGGFLSLLDRRLRIGVGQRAGKPPLSQSPKIGPALPAE
ncbi:heme lyase CcmF/NrfE family subunit [Rhodomicrobium lacus]|uniref:heme lyase CcmF/NrfE family subunit n=1 Tax=Rhodomicrobium lacus TaxID=2498452 RepID=UPI000F8D07B4|nr:heme lyase CcmF/NrfE family subunit [Rhodomicrobium lacus]